MALNIKSATAERTVRMLAQRTGETITEAIERSARERLDRLEKAKGAKSKVAKWRALLKEYGVEPTTESWDWKSEMYDENGLSR